MSEPQVLQTNSSTVKCAWWSGEWLRLCEERGQVSGWLKHEVVIHAHICQRYECNLMEGVDREAARRNEGIGVKE